MWAKLVVAYFTSGLAAQCTNPQMQVFRMLPKVTLRATIGPSTELKGLLWAH